MVRLGTYYSDYGAIGSTLQSLQNILGVPFGSLQMGGNFDVRPPGTESWLRPWRVVTVAYYRYKDI